MLEDFYKENPGFDQWDKLFCKDFGSLEEVIQYFPDWWDNKYETMSPSEIIQDWERENSCTLIEFKERWFLFFQLE